MADMVATEEEGWGALTVYVWPGEVPRYYAPRMMVHITRGIVH